VKIDELTNVDITPITLDFGTVRQGSTNNTPNNGPIKFTAVAGANTNMTVTFTGVTEGLFSLIQLEIPSGIWVNILTHPDVSLDCVLNADGGCTYTPVTVNSKLSIPIGFPSGTKIGTITYTITGIHP